MEFASVFNRFGSKVTVLEMLPRIVPVEDEDVSKELERVFKKQGIRVETGAKAENIRKTGEGVQLTATLANGKTEEMQFDEAADRRRPPSEHRQVRPREHEGPARSRLHQGEWVPADGRARRLRHRRHRGGNAATRPRRDNGRHGRARRT